MLGIIVLIIAIVALQHPSNSGTAADTTSPAHQSSSAGAHPTTTTSPKSSSPGSSVPKSSASAGAGASSSAQSLPLVVLNNTTVTHLAADAAALFKQAGWTVTSYGNYQNNIASTCAYYDPSVAGAQAAATLLKSQFPSIVRVKPKFPGLVAGPIVVVLTPDFKTA